jgi:hypothetical protein
MLSFLRKYQGVILFIVGLTLLLPFSFFGTFRAFNALHTQKETPIGRTLDGTKFTRSDVRQIAQLLQEERGATTLLGEWIQMGIVDQICTTYAPYLQKEWQTRWHRVKRAHFYVHPTEPLINARALWMQLAPELMEEVKKLQEEQECPSDFGARWIKLLQLQEKCPPELIRRILVHQQSQMKGVPHDPRLVSESCSLFGYQSVSDWLGRDFFHFFAQVVLNGAARAKHKGLRIEEGEVERDLRHRGFTWEGEERLRLWEKVMLFQRLLHDLGEAVLIDDLEIRKQVARTNETAYLELYTLPSELQFHSLDDFLAYQTYLSLVSLQPDLAAIGQQAPELLVARYRLRYAEIDLKKIGARIPLQEVWEWQLTHWYELRSKFSKLPEANGEDRFSLLERQDANMRARMDEWTREQIVQEHPERIEREFEVALVQEREVAISLDDKRIDFLPIRKIKEFRSFLEKPEGDFRDRQLLFRLSMVEKIADRELLSLAVAKQKGILNTEAFLQKCYEKVRLSDPVAFRDEQGNWKPVAAVKEEVVRRMFPDPMHLTFHKPMEQLFAAVREGQDTAPTIGLWTLCKSERVITRSSSTDWLHVEPFQLEPGHWSSLSVPENGELSFFFLKERESRIPTQSEVLEQIRINKRELSREVQKLFLEQLMHEMERKGTMVFPDEIYKNT